MVSKGARCSHVINGKKCVATENMCYFAHMSAEDPYVAGYLKTKYANDYQRDFEETVMLPKVWDPTKTKGDPIPCYDTMSIVCIEGWKDSA